MPLPRNIYKSFRDPRNLTSSGNALVNNSKRWDEPTYLTFSVFFKGDITERYRNKTINTNFDWFPHPLLSDVVQDVYDAREEYSTIQFLRDNNETVREEMLKRFINDLNDIQDYYPWYFQGVSGINSLLNVVPERGRRVPTDAKLTFKVLEGIDQKMTNLLNLYKNVAWDSTYQRWMLPDMMRNFVMEIYITEFRTFHQPRANASQEIATGAVNDRSFFQKIGDGIVNTFKPSAIPEPVDLVLDLVQKTLPTIKIVCERCEIDISSINKNLDDFSVSDIPEMHEIEFDIKVGQVTEEYVNPILDYYYSDKVINGRARSQEFGPGSDSVTESKDLNADGTPKLSGADPLRPSTSTTGERAKINPDLAQRELTSYQKHTSGTPFHENQNDRAAIHKSLGSDGQPPKGSTLNPDFDPVEPNTWGGNAINFGTAFVENFVEDAIDKATVTKIPGLGISVNEAVAAIESKDFVTVFGAVAAAINKVNEQSVPPSGLLDGDLSSNTFRNFLQGVASSEATNENSIDLKKFADLALNDRGTFDRIIDYSQATDLVGFDTGEKNIPNPIDGATSQSEIVNAQTQGDRSKATDLDGDTSNLTPEPIIYDGVPSSSATNNPIQGGG